MERSEALLRLAKPKRKGLVGLVFSRLFLVAALLVLEVLLFVGLYLWFKEYFPHFIVVQTVFALGMVLYLFNCSMDSTAKLTWLFIIALLPIPGAIFLFFTQKNFGHRTLKSRSEEMIRRTKDAIAQDPAVLEKLNADGSGTDDLHRYVNRSGCFPIFENTAVRYFPSGEEKFAAMLEELERAEKFIFMEYFIIEEGYMWGRILEILVRKVREGVDVRVMYDGMCEISNLPADYPKRLEAQGIRAKAFAPIQPLVSTHYNYRDHRKILVIDNKVAFNGGVNLADEYINRKERFGRWKDAAVMLRGEAVPSFTLMFLQMWNINEREPDFSAVDAEGLSVPSAGFVMPYGDCPLDGDKVGENLYMDILYHANRYVHIMTPYLILDGELERALIYAGERGTDVKIILPGIPDKKLAWALAKTHYASLLASGVKIYEYVPGFVHAKSFVADDREAVVGTINLDYRSLYHHFECGTYMYKTGCVADIERDFQETLAECRPVTMETIRDEKWTYRLAGGLMKLIAPLL